MDKKLRSIGIYITESILIGTCIMVCAILTVPLDDHGHDLAYLGPVILTYAFMKTSILFIQEALIIKNPYKLLKLLVSVAFVGSVLLLFSKNPQRPLYFVGASLVGIGLSPFSTIYKQYLQPPVNKGPRPKYIKVIPIIIALAIVIVCIICKNTGSRVILYLWAAHIFLILLYVFDVFKEKGNYFGNMVELKEGWLIRSIPIAVLFFLMIATNGYKRTGTPFLLSVLTVLFVFLIVFFIRYDGKQKQVMYLESIWVGAVFGFLIFYCPVYLKDMYLNKYIILLYLLVILSAFTCPILANIFNGMSRYKTIATCMCVTILGLLLLITQNNILFFIGFYISIMFVSYIKPLNLLSYIEKDVDNKCDYKIEQDSLYNLGNGLVQSYTMIVFSVVGILLTDSRHTIMSEYLFPSNANENSLILIISGSICIASLIAFLLVIVAKSSVKSEK